MGGAGDLLSLSLNVPPWEDLHELSLDELRTTNLVTTDAVAEVLPQIGGAAVPAAVVAAKSVQDRLASSVANDLAVATPAKSTKTADALAPMASVAAAPSQ
jgi:DNA-binding ferritin-like protein